MRYAPVTTFDLTATILDIAGGTLRGMDGESKAGLLYGADRGWSYPMLTEGLLKDVHRSAKGFGSGLTEIGIRTGRYKYVSYADGDRELYDLVTDPLELESRIDDPAYSTVQRDLDRLWWDTRTAASEACRAPLPASYQRTKRQLVDQVVRAHDEVGRCYGE